MGHSAVWLKNLATDGHNAVALDGGAAGRRTEATKTIVSDLGRHEETIRCGGRMSAIGVTGANFDSAADPAPDTADT